MIWIPDLEEVDEVIGLERSVESCRQGMKKREYRRELRQDMKRSKKSTKLEILGFVSNASQLWSGVEDVEASLEFPEKRIFLFEYKGRFSLKAERGLNKMNSSTDLQSLIT